MESYGQSYMLCLTQLQSTPHECFLALVNVWHRLFLQVIKDIRHIASCQHDLGDVQVVMSSHVRCYVSYAHASTWQRVSSSALNLMSVNDGLSMMCSKYTQMKIKAIIFADIYIVFTHCCHTWESKN